MTSPFQQKLPIALLPVSSALAALHVSRAHLLDPNYGTSVTSTHCAKCGTYLLNGDGQIRLGRKRRSTRLFKTCDACGWNDETVVHKGNAGLFEPSRKVKRRQLGAQRPSGPHSQMMASPPIQKPDTSVWSDAPAQISSSSSTASQPPHPKPRPKKKSAL